MEHVSKAPSRAATFDRYRSPQPTVSKPFVKPAAKPSANWQVGSKASHKKWGVGTVVSVRGEGDDLELDIAFPGEGIKRLLAKFAPIEKV